MPEYMSSPAFTMLYKVRTGSKKLEILIYIRPDPYKSVIRPYNGNISVVKGTLSVIRLTAGLITRRVADFCR